MTILTAIIQRDEDFYIAKCAEIGTTSQGKTIKEAVTNLREATELYLEEFSQEKFTHTFLTTFEVKA